MSKDKIIAVFGLGSFGLEICKVLSQRGNKVIAVDNKSHLIESVKNTVSEAIQVDTTDENTFSNELLTDIDIAIVGIGENIESSIITTAILKKNNVPYIMARAVTDIHADILKQVGANSVINVEIEAGRRIANTLVSPDIIDMIPISPQQSIAEIVAKKEFVGKSIAELGIRNKYNINIISIKRNITEIDQLGNPISTVKVVPPNPEEKIKENDIFVAVGNETDLQSIKGVKE